MLLEVSGMPGTCSMQIARVTFDHRQTNGLVLNIIGHSMYRRRETHTYDFYVYLTANAFVLSLYNTSIKANSLHHIQSHFIKKISNLSYTRDPELN